MADLSPFTLNPLKSSISLCLLAFTLHFPGRSDWGKCSSTCDGGLQTRWRDIAHHAYEDKAIPCSGVRLVFEFHW